MDKAFVVTSGRYSDYGIRGVFSTKENAERYIQNRNAAKDQTSLQEFEIEEWPLDAGLQEREYNRYSCAILIQTGEVVSTTGPHLEWGLPETKTMILRWKDGEVCRAWSPESQDHALKLAVEGRQAHLRENSR